MEQTITIKGTNQGLIIYMNDQCSYEYALNELHKTISSQPSAENAPAAKVTLKLGKRYVTQAQTEEISSLFEQNHHMSLDEIETDVVDKQEALAWKDEIDVKVYSQIVRSGQTFTVTGDLLLVGDVNPGGIIQASGNIFVMGSLSGVAHAGIDGNRESIIAASYMKPSQLRIANYISRAPDYESEGVYMEYGSIHPEENKIVISPINTLSKHKVQSLGLERRIFNG